MLSPNLVEVTGASLELDPAAHPLTGPIRASRNGYKWSFNAPVESFRGLCSTDGLHTLFTHCDHDHTGVPVWYAFSSAEERSMGVAMTTADKVGWKIAVRILGATSYREIQALIAAGDREAFKKLPGVGPKTGEKLAAILFVAAPAPPVEALPTPPPLDEDAVAALRVLGYKTGPARAAVEQAGSGLTTSALIKAALKCLQ